MLYFFTCFVQFFENVNLVARYAVEIRKKCAQRGKLSFCQK